MVTFRGWLRDQEKREDAVGWTARYWRDLDNTPKLSSPSTIERHLEQRDLFSTQEGLREAWDTTMTEYRQQRLIQSAQDAGVTPDMLGQQQQAPPGDQQPALPGMPSPGQVVARAAQAGIDAAQRPRVSVSLEMLSAKLDAIMAALGITMPDGLTIVPIDWQELWEQAERERAAAGE